MPISQQATPWTALMQKTTHLTNYQSTNINTDFSSKYNMSHWHKGPYCSTTTKPQPSSPIETAQSYVAGNKTSRFMIGILILLHLLWVWWEKHQDIATLWSKGKMVDFSQQIFVHDFCLQPTWISLTILKYIHYRQHIYKSTSMV